MKDIELDALAVLVSAYAVKTVVENYARYSRGQTPTHDGFAAPDEMRTLQEELERRGVIKHSFLKETES